MTALVPYLCTILTKAETDLQLELPGPGAGPISDISVTLKTSDGPSTVILTPGIST